MPRWGQDTDPKRSASFRVSQTDHDRIMAAADRAGMSLSAFVFRAVMADLGRPVPTPPPVVDRVMCPECGMLL